jgi:hypothetical protein
LINTLRNMIRRARTERRERRAETNADLQLEDSLAGFKTIGNGGRRSTSDFEDDRDWDPSDEGDIFFR